jgi:ferredoxin
VPYVIAEPCIDVKDSACVDACPVDCIHSRRDEAPFELCECCTSIRWSASIVAPVSAIFRESDLPDKWSEYAEVNRAHYGRE